MLRATLDGREVGSGTMQDVQAAVAEVITGLVAEDPDEYAKDAQRAQRAFADGAVDERVRDSGYWTLVLGEKTVTVTRKGWRR